MKMTISDVRTSNSNKGWKKFLPYILLIPAFFGIVLINFYPFIKTIISSFSFTNEYGDWIKWAGTYFWKFMFTTEDGIFWKMLANTMVFALLNFVITLVLGMILALLCVEAGRFKKVYQMIFALPIAVSSVAASVMWKFIFQGDGGLLNTLTGIDINWLYDTRTAMIMLSVVTSWTHVGSTFLLLLAGFRGVSKDLVEAAIVDGANGIQRAIKIMIPMASPQIFYVVFTNILSAIKAFAQIKLLTNGGPADSTRTIMYEIYRSGSMLGQYEYACCASIVLFLVIFFVTRIQFAVEDKLVHYK